MVGRVFPSTRTTTLAIESMAKGATGPEEAVEIAIGAGDDTGNSSERRPVDKLLLVEQGGFGIMYKQNKNQQRARERRSMKGEILCSIFFLFDRDSNRNSQPSEEKNTENR